MRYNKLHKSIENDYNYMKLKEDYDPLSTEKNLMTLEPPKISGNSGDKKK
jgi:hypothetical protein